MIYSEDKTYMIVVKHEGDAQFGFSGKIPKDLNEDEMQDFVYNFLIEHSRQEKNNFYKQAIEAFKELEERGAPKGCHRNEVTFEEGLIAHLKESDEWKIHITEVEKAEHINEYVEKMRKEGHKIETQKATAEYSKDSEGEIKLEKIHKEYTGYDLKEPKKEIKENNYKL